MSDLTAARLAATVARAARTHLRCHTQGFATVADVRELTDDIENLAAEITRLTAERDAAVEALDAFAADLDKLDGKPVIA